jgi:hypothetical protein
LGRKIKSKLHCEERDIHTELQIERYRRKRVIQKKERDTEERERYRRKREIQKKERDTERKREIQREKKIQTQRDTDIDKCRGDRDREKTHIGKRDPERKNLRVGSTTGVGGKEGVYDE